MAGAYWQGLLTQHGTRRHLATMLGCLTDEALESFEREGPTMRNSKEVDATNARLEAICTAMRNGEKLRWVPCSVSGNGTDSNWRDLFIGRRELTLEEELDVVCSTLFFHGFEDELGIIEVTLRE